MDKEWKDKEWKDISLKDIKLNRRDFIKILIGIAVASGIGYYLYKLLSKHEPYYQIYLENGVANAYNVREKSVDYQDSDHYSVIQYALDHLPSRKEKEKVHLKGDFISRDTIKIPSFTIFELEGSITLGDNVDKILVQELDSEMGTFQIEMISGIYDGNKSKQLVSAAADHIVHFKKVTNSHFKDMIMQNAANDGFILDSDCNNNICENLVGKWSGTGYTGPGATNDGNGLNDRGDNNTWIDCISEDNYSDCWVIKCRDSKFIRCVGRGSKNAVGFGIFGDRNITGNQFEDCKAYNNFHSGFSSTIPKASQGKAIKVEDNYIQGEFYNNGMDKTQDDMAGVRFVNSTTDGFCRNNKVDIIVYNNNQVGFYIKQDSIKDNTGTIVAYDNTGDVNIGGKSNSFSIYAPKGKNKIVVDTGNKVEYINCGYKDSLAVNKYCQKK